MAATTFGEFVYPALATGAMALFYNKLVVDVGAARKNYTVPFPKMTGNEQFERVVRVQLNTLEQMPVFLTGMWMFSAFINAKIGGGLGLAYVVSRAIYRHQYTSSGNVAYGTVPGYAINAVFQFGVIAAASYELYKRFVKV